MPQTCPDLLGLATLSLLVLVACGLGASVRLLLALFRLGQEIKVGVHAHALQLGLMSTSLTGPLATLIQDAQDAHALNLTLRERLSVAEARDQATARAAQGDSPGQPA